jgi:hypothetical protein
MFAEHKMLTGMLMFKNKINPSSGREAMTTEITTGGNAGEVSD